MWKSCKKKMGDKSILNHLSQRESCKNYYDEDNMEYLKNWSDKRNRSKKSSYYERNKSSINSKKITEVQEEKRRRRKGNSQKKDKK